MFMVQVDLPAAFVIGQIYAMLAKSYLKKEPRKFTNKLLGPLNFFMSCCFAPAGMFLLVGWPAWEVMYNTGWVENPYNRPWVAGFYVFFGIVMVVLGNVGFILAHHWYRKDLDKRVTIGIAAGSFLTVLPFLIRWGIWWKIGTYSDFIAKKGYSFWNPPFFHGWLGIMICAFVSALVMGIWFKKKGNQLEP